jgi:hypothetical protein
MGAYAAQVACAVCGDYGCLAGYRESLAPTRADTGNAAFVDLVCHALAMGFSDKWEKTNNRSLITDHRSPITKQFTK